MRPQQAFFFSQNNTLSTPDQEKHRFRCKKKNISPTLWGIPENTVDKRGRTHAATILKLCSNPEGVVAIRRWLTPW